MRVVAKFPPSLSEKEIRSYLSGEVTDEFSKTIEKKISVDEFSKMAVEGFKENPRGMTDFRDTQNAFEGRLLKISRWKFYHSFILVFAIAIGIYSVGAYYLLQSEEARKIIADEKKMIKILPEVIDPQ